MPKGIRGFPGVSHGPEPLSHLLGGCCACTGRGTMESAGPLTSSLLMQGAICDVRSSPYKADLQRRWGEEEVASSACQGLVSLSLPPKSFVARATCRGEEFSGLLDLPMKDAAPALASLLFYGNIVSIYL